MRHYFLPNHLESPRHTRLTNAARCALVLFVSCAAAGLKAQDAAPTGLQLRSVSAYFEYYAAGLPQGSGFALSLQPLSNAVGGASAEIGWLKSSERTTSSFSYSSSVIGGARYSEWNAWNHSASFTTSHYFTPRWLFSVSLAGDIRSQEQSLFSPTAMSTIAAVPSTFDELVTGMLGNGNKFTNPQLTSAINTAQLADSPVLNLLYGERTFMSAARASLSYSYSPRLTMFFQGSVNRTQNISGSQNVVDQNSYLLPLTISGNVGMGIAYALTSHTQVGGNVNVSRSSSLSDSYTTTSLATITTNLGAHWLIQAHGGVGVSTPVRQSSFQLSTAPRPALGGSLTFKAPSQIVIASFDRVVSDSFGFGASISSSGAFTWHWSRPNRAWWLDANVGWQQLEGNGLPSTSGLRATAGIGRSIGTHIALSTQYGFLDSSGALARVVYNQQRNAVRVSLLWLPHASVSR